MEVDIARQGATAIARRATSNPREMLLGLIDRYKNSSKEKIFKLFRDHLEDDPEYREAVEWYFFTNMYEYAITVPSRNKAKDPIVRATERAERREIIERIKERIILLDLTMPNGKQMRDCTGAEMSRFGDRYKKIASAVGKNKMVGEILSETQVRTIMG